MERKNSAQVLEELVALMRDYSSVYRGSYLPSRTTQIEAEPGANILRESVAEHVGLLPITASYLHPHLESQVDLGKALTMLSIHDIGETVVGDVLTVKHEKTDGHKDDEYNAALAQLHPSFHDLFREFDANDTNEAKYAYSIDKITPNIYELIIDKQIARARHEHFGFSIHDAVAKDVDLMAWDPFLERLYGELIEQIRNKFS